MLQIVDAIAAYWLALNVRPPLPGRSDPPSERDA
jgi:hypothetical protein